MIRDDALTAVSGSHSSFRLLHKPTCLLHAFRSPQTCHARLARLTISSSLQR
jgi:hypothetical protein